MGANRKALIRYNLSSISGASTAADFKLTMIDWNIYYTNHPCADISVWGLNDGDSEENWNQNEVNYYNMPAAWTNGNQSYRMCDTNHAMRIGTFNCGEISGIDTYTMEEDFTNSLLDFVNADTDGQVTLIICPPSHRSIYFASRENDSLSTPTLILEGVTPAQQIVSTASGVFLDEGSTNSLFGIRFIYAPATAVTVTVSKVSGDSDISVADSGAAVSETKLIFTPSNYDEYQYVHNS